MGNGQSTSSSIDQIKQIYAIYANSLIKKQKLKPDKQKVSRDVIKQLFQSFTKYRQYCWSQDITPLFVSFFKDNLETLWNNDRQIFYRQMLQNSGLMNNNHRKITNYQDQFYNCQAIKLKQEQEFPDTRSFDNRINALNCSIIDQEEMLPILINKKPKPNNKSVMHHSMMQFENNFEFSHDSENLKHNSEYYDSQILRSSVIVPETVFVERLDDNSKYKVNNLLNFYKIFSESLQQMIRNITLMACPLKHFEAELKRKVKLKKIKSIEQTGSVIRDTRNAALLRKKKQYNNTYLLLEIRDFTEGYTQFIWKYLNLYRFDETQFSTFITIETAYGVVLKLVWSFTSWIGQRGYEWEQNQIPKALQQFAEQQRLSFSGSDKKKKKKNKIQISPQIIKLGSDLTEQTNPQKYLKKIVIIYRQLSKNCSSADQLMTHYQIFFQQLAKRNKCQRLLRMQLIIQKLLKMEDSCGQICYAWTTWNIMIETIKKIISAGTKEKEVQQDFKKFLDKVEKSRLSG